MCFSLTVGYTSNDKLLCSVYLLFITLIKMDACYISYILLFLFGAQALTSQDGHSGNDTHSGLPQRMGSENVWNLAKDQWFNPVLQNQSTLDAWLRGNRLDLHTSKPVYLSSGERLNRRKRSEYEVDCEGLCSNSLCQWNEEWDEELNRIPRFIKYAACVSSDCDFNVYGLGNHVKNRLRRKTYCDTVRTDIRVLENDREKWMTHWPIACICAKRPTVAHDQPSDTDIIVSAFSAHRMPARHGFAGSVQRDHISYSPDSSDESPGIRLASFTRSQRRQLRQQRRRIAQNSETFEQLMRRKTRNRVTP